MSQPNPDAEALAAAHGEARTRAEAGDLTGARTLLEDALAIGEVRLGHTHPRLAPLMVDLATIARNLGNLTEASTQLRRAYAIIVAASGPENATALSVEGRLAAVTYRLGEPTEAYDWHLANVGTRVLGEEHPAVRGAHERLASRPTPPESPQHHYVPSPESPGVFNRVAADPLPPPLPPGPVSYAPEHVPEPDHAPGDPGQAPGYPGGTQHPDGPAADPYRPVPDPFRPMPDPFRPVPDPYQPSPDPYLSTPDPYEEPSGIYAVEQPEYDDGEIWREPRVERSRRGHRGGVAMVATLGAAVLIAATVLAVELFNPRQANPPAAVPTTAAAQPTIATTTETPTVSLPPANLAIKDNGGSVVLTWVDPSDGKVPFIVAGGRDGAGSVALEKVPPGRTTSTIYGLNINYNYCFTVTAVWSSEMTAPSIRTCTSRSSASRTP